ncbi:MAG TPA: hypothetical protein VNF73_11960, partial [Candidatus Saccharimonadales bacterium]|nr:hypothetical protein [Candidatus Saccharimonadales bacterium]
VAVVALVASAWWRGRRLDRGRHLGPDRRPDRHRDSRSPRVGEIVGVLLALAALPVAMLHDWLLTGDPLWFLSVPADYTAIYDAGLRPIDPVRFAGTFAAHEAGLLPLVVVAIVGLAALTRARERLMAAGIGALAVGVMGLLFLLAARATYISNRYYEPIDLAVLPAAAIGAGVIAAIAGVALPRLGTDAQRRRAGTRSTTLGVVLAAFAVVVALALTWAPLPLDRRATAELDNVRQASVNLARVIPDARAPLLDGAVRQGDVPAQAGAPAADLRTVALLAPSRDVSRIAVELNTRMTLVGDLYAFLLRWGIGGLRSGQYVLHDAAADRPVALFAPFELDGSEETTNVGAVTLTRRFSLGAPGQGSGIWLDQVR